jgi:hypothetical protein
VHDAPQTATTANLSGILPQNGEEMTDEEMTDEELIKELRAWNGSLFDDDAFEVAYRIEQLVKERDALLRVVTDNHLALKRAEAAEAKLAKAVGALQKLVKLDDDYSPFGGELLRDRVVRTWEEARAVLAELEKTE